MPVCSHQLHIRTVSTSVMLYYSWWCTTTLPCPQKIAASSTFLYSWSSPTVISLSLSCWIGDSCPGIILTATGDTTWLVKESNTARDDGGMAYSNTPEGGVRGWGGGGVDCNHSTLLSIDESKQQQLPQSVKWSHAFWAQTFLRPVL